MSEKWKKKHYDMPPKLELFGKAFYKRFMHPTLSTLHQAQKNALQALVQWFSNPDTETKTAVVVMPTGTGKTGIICCLPFSLMSQLPSGKIDTNKPILIVAPGLDILHQLEENLSGSSDSKSFLERRGLLEKRDIKNKANYSVHVVKTSSDVEKLESITNEFDIALSNSQKWRKAKFADYANYENLPSDLFSIVIVDEAHHLPAKQWREIVKKFQAYAKIVFFTATPYRADGKEITIDRAISTKGYAYHLTQQKAITQKLIRPVKMMEIPLSRTPPMKKMRYDSRKAEEEEERMFYGREVLTKIKRRMKEKNLSHSLPGGQKHAAIVITKNIQEANCVKKICIKELQFEASIVKVVHTAAIKTVTKRAEVIKEIKDGHIQVVIIVQMLLEGFAHPPFSIAGIVTKIRSPVKFAKFVGRIQQLVRHTHQDGTQKVEKGIVGDVITHQYFEQRQLFKEYFVSAGSASDWFVSLEYESSDGEFDSEDDFEEDDSLLASSVQVKQEEPSDSSEDDYEDDKKQESSDSSEDGYEEDHNLCTDRVQVKQEEPSDSSEDDDEEKFTSKVQAKPEELSSHEHLENDSEGDSNSSTSSKELQEDEIWPVRYQPRRIFYFDDFDDNSEDEVY